MTIIVYPAVVTAAPAGELTCRFVDLAELAVSAASSAELIGLARERLSAELQHLERQGATWPTPTSISDVRAPEGGSVILVDVSVEDTPVRLTISMGERLLKRVDQDAEARSMTRSGYLALGARRLLGDAGEPVGGRRLHDEVAALGRRVNETLGPDSPLGRTLTELDAIALDGLSRLRNEFSSALRHRRHADDEPTTSPGDQADAAPGASSPGETPGG